VDIIDARTLQLTRTGASAPQTLAARRAGVHDDDVHVPRDADWIRWPRGGLPKVKVMVGGYNLRVYGKSR
jgi:hypothetical protein